MYMEPPGELVVSLSIPPGVPIDDSSDVAQSDVNTERELPS